MLSCPPVKIHSLHHCCLLLLLTPLNFRLIAFGSNLLRSSKLLTFIYFIDPFSPITATDTMQLLVTVSNPIRTTVALISASAFGNVSFFPSFFPFIFPDLRFVLEVNEFAYYAGKENTCITRQDMASFHTFILNCYTRKTLENFRVSIVTSLTLCAS